MNSSEKRLLCLVNSRSGGNKGAEIAKLLPGLKLSGIDEIEVKLLDESSPLPLAQEVENKYSHVLVAGGDGTFSSVLGNYLNSKIDFILLPLGTGNDLARELGLKKIWRNNLQAFLVHCLNLPVETLQIWQANLLSENSEPKAFRFLNYISFGWDGLIVQRFEELRRKGIFPSGKFGPWGNRSLYALAALKYPYYQLPSLSIEADSKLIELNASLRSLIISNICSVMGLGMTNLKGNISDDQIEICEVRNVFDYVKMILPAKLRSPRKLCSVVQAKDIVVKFNNQNIPAPIQVDGEFIGLFQGSSAEIRSIGTVLVRRSKS